MVNQLRERLSRNNIRISIPDNQTYVVTHYLSRTRLRLAPTAPKLLLKAQYPSTWTATSRTVSPNSPTVLEEAGLSNPVTESTKNGSGCYSRDHQVIRCSMGPSWPSSRKWVCRRPPIPLWYWQIVICRAHQLARTSSSGKHSQRRFQM